MIIYSLLIGLVLFSVYLNVKNGQFNKLYQLIEKKNLKLSLIGLSIIFSPLLIFLISSHLLTKNPNYTSTTTNNFIPVQIQSALLSAFIAWLITSRRNKTDLAFTLHREFNDKEMYIARIKADEFISSKKENRKLLTEMYGKYEYRSESDNLKSLLLVIQFYERLWLVIDNNQVNIELIPELFARIFYAWYIRSFEEQLIPTNWESAIRIKKLKEWIDFKANESEREAWETEAHNQKHEYHKSDEVLVAMEPQPTLSCLVFWTW